MQCIFEPGPSGDGIHLEDGFHEVEKTYVDFSSYAVEEIDEAIAVTRGGSAIIRDCVFQGAEKLALIGGGDEEWRSMEEGKTVVFLNCIFRDGSRRMPEVQCGMKCLLVNCTIENWCEPSRQPKNPAKARGFGAWAHDGGEIIAVKCTFNQKPFWKGLPLMIFDVLGHLGNAINESGIKAIFNWRSWIPGIMRGLTASDGGKTYAFKCDKNRKWIRIEGEMDKDAFWKLEDVRMILESSPSVKEYLNKIGIDEMRNEAVE